MAQDDVERAIKRAKKEKDYPSKNHAPKSIDNDGLLSNQRETVFNDEDSGESSEARKHELSKAERKALRRARRAQEQSTPIDSVIQSTVTSTYNSEADDQARKELKRAEKARRKAERAAELNGTKSATARGEDVFNSDMVAGITYEEHEELKQLPQAEIDAFISDKRLTVEDSLKQPYKPVVSFKYLPCGENIDSTQFANFASPTPIQAACWPYLLAARDMVGVAETGSGKTLAFGVPCVRYIARLGKKDRKGIKACIVSPTRELAMQIYEQMTKLAERSGLKVSCVYGGVSRDLQRGTLKGTNIIVATPGRLNDFISDGSIDLSEVTYLVLDEADRMLDKGFEQDVRKIILKTSSTGRQTSMFTATWPQSIRDLASTFMDNPVKVTIGDNASGELRANTRVVQEVEVIDEREKQGRLIELLKQYQSGKNRTDRILVFCLYKKEATRIEEFIRRRGFPVAGIHGDLSQQKRTESLDAFKKGTTPLLVATDVAARGLDIPAVKLVINVTFPLTVEDYVHRIGR